MTVWVCLKEQLITVLLKTDYCPSGRRGNCWRLGGRWCGGGDGALPGEIGVGAAGAAKSVNR